MQRALDLTFKRSLPFLILAPPEFRDELRMRLIGINQYCIQNSPDLFEEELKRINKMLTAKHDFGESVNVQLYYLQSRMQPVNETLAEIMNRVKTLERQIIYLKSTNSDVSIKQIRTLPKQNIQKTLTCDGEKSTIDKVFDLIRENSPNYVTTEEIFEKTGLEHNKIYYRICSALVTIKRADMAKHIEMKEDYRVTPSSTLCKAYRWVDEEKYVDES
jgi:hypothetical protein